MIRILEKAEEGWNLKKLMERIKYWRETTRDEGVFFDGGKFAICRYDYKEEKVIE